MANAPREVAFYILLGAERDPSISIDAHTQSKLNAKGISRDERRWVMELVYGVTRNRLKLDAWIESSFKGQYHKAQHAVKVLLRMGVFQLKLMSTADHAAINETVKLSRKVKQSRSAGLINAVLRKVQDTPFEDILSAIPDELDRMAAETSHPQWLLKRWISRYSPETVSSLCTRNNLTPSLWIRRNQLYTNVEDFEELLRKEGIEFERSTVLDTFYRIDHTGSLIQSPEFRAGWFSFQDLAAGLVAHIVEAGENQVIVDACAAPGGKMAFLAETCGPGTRIIACDASPKRLERVRENVERLHLNNVEVRQLDATQEQLPAADRILLDVPCSGTGVLGRRADARWHRSEADLASLVQIQSKILGNSWTALRSGGLLIYATCSLEPEENWELVEKTLEQLDGAVIEPIRADFLKPYIDEKGALSTLPWKHDMDGMFAVKIRKSG